MQYGANMYGSQPYYTVLEDDGSAHSVAIVNSNAQGRVVRLSILRYKKRLQIDSTAYIKQ